MLSKITRAIRVRTSEVTQELETWSTPLVDLTASFSQLAPDFAITTFYETADTYGVRVVPEGSAKLGQRNERHVGLRGNHFQICKFEDEADPNYRRVLKRVEAEAAAILEGEVVSITSPPVLQSLPDIVQKTSLEVGDTSENSPSLEDDAGAERDAGLESRLSALPRPQIDHYHYPTA